ncbi:MAG: hypothetical protein WB014_04765 [Methanosarcina sp.]
MYYIVGVVAKLTNSTVFDSAEAMFYIHLYSFHTHIMYSQKRGPTTRPDVIGCEIIPIYKGNKIGVTVFMDPEVFRRVEDVRNPKLSSSAHCAKLLEKAIGIKQ